MLYNIIKTLISALLIVTIAEVSKKYSFIGAVLASIPLVSVLAMIWLYIDTKNVAQIATLSLEIFWLVIPSLVLFISLPILLSRQINFYIALLLAIACTSVAYLVMITLLKKFGLI